MPVHAHHRFDGGALTTSQKMGNGIPGRWPSVGGREFCLDPLVGHEEDHVPVVLTSGVRLGQMRLHLLDQIVLVGSGDRFTARAIEICLRHIFTIAYVR